MQSLSRCNKRIGRFGPAKDAVLCTQQSYENGNFWIFEAVEDIGTVFTPRQYFLQMVTMGMENLKMQSLSKCNKRTGRFGPAKNAVSCTE